MENRRNQEIKWQSKLKIQNKKGTNKNNQINKKKGGGEGSKSKTIMLPFGANFSHPFVAHTNRPWCSRWSGLCCQWTVLSQTSWQWLNRQWSRVKNLDASEPVGWPIVLNKRGRLCCAWPCNIVYSGPRCLLSFLLFFVHIPISYHSSFPTVLSPPRSWLSRLAVGP